MSTPPRGKHYFAAIPARALTDRRLDGGRFLLLATIALYARMNAGQGCWSSARTLAELTGLSLGTIKNYIGDLIAWGYVTRQARDGKTHRTLYVVYDDPADLAVLKGTARPVISRSDGSDRDPSSGEAQPVISRDDPKIDSESVGESESSYEALSQSEDMARSALTGASTLRNSAEAARRPNGAAHDVELSDDEIAFQGRTNDLAWLSEHVAKLRHRTTIEPLQAGLCTEIKAQVDAIKARWPEDQEIAEQARLLLQDLPSSGHGPHYDELTRELRADHNDAAKFLRQLAGWLEEPRQPLRAHERSAADGWYARCDEIVETYSQENVQLAGWAHRLREELANLIDEYDNNRNTE
jgi:hypothetical protein